MLNPPYHRWPPKFPALQHGAVHAARSAGARLVSLENVYLYGRPDGSTLTEDSPHRSHTPHTYTFVPDVARALAVLGQAPEATGVWHAPNDPGTTTTREVVRLAARMSGHDDVAVHRTPTRLLRAMGLANPAVREVVEMEYEFAEPFVVSSDRVTERFGLRATRIEDGLAATLEAMRSRSREALSPSRRKRVRSVRTAGGTQLAARPS